MMLRLYACPMLALGALAGSNVGDGEYRIGQTMRLARAASALALFVLLGLPALAQPPGTGGPNADVIQKITPELLTELLREVGYRARVDKADQNEPRIVVNFWSDEVFSGVRLGACDRDGCLLMRFFVNLGRDMTISDAWVKSWNRNKILVKAVQLTDNSLLLSMDVAVWGGVTRDYVKQMAQTFVSIASTAADFQP
jgi:hypothetical protein